MRLWMGVHVCERARVRAWVCARACVRVCWCGGRGLYSSPSRLYISNAMNKVRTYTNEILCYH